MNRWWAGWRLSLRLARRDSLRSRARSVLVLVMIALPVLAVSAADVVLQTQDVSPVESLDRRLGSAEASVTVQQGVSRVVQAPDPQHGTSSDGRRSATPLTAEEVSHLLGGARLAEVRTGDAAVVTAKGEVYALSAELDLRDPLAKGLFRLTSGRWPDATGEVVVNQALAAKGYAVGDVLDVANGRSTDPAIVGIAESTTVRDSPAAAGPVGSLHVRTYGATTWLVGGGPVPWSTVLELNAHGATVLSRAVVADPPPVPPEVAQHASDGTSGDVIAVLVLIVVMALLEVVLLAGPAFAVGARRQARSLALMASAGATPPQTRRVVLAGAVLLGGMASLVGVVAGIGVGRALVPLLQRRDDSWFGPFEVPWLHLVGVAGFGLLSALLAAVVPATIASRQDVVAVLAGRRGDRKPSLRSPILGLVLLGLGIAGAAIGSRSSGNDGAYLIAGAAIVSVFGMVLLVPVVLVGVSALAKRLPLTLRYAARDAARHRTRTVPAVAAVAATVAGVVALGIALSSDEAQNQAQYTPSLARGVGLVTGTGDYAAYEQLVRREVPTATVAPVTGVTSPAHGFRDISFTAPGSRVSLLTSFGSSFGSDVLVSDGRLPTGVIGLDAEARSRAGAALAAGRSVVFSDTGSTPDEVRIHETTFKNNGRKQGDPLRARVAALVLPMGRDVVGQPQAILSTADAERIGLPVGTVGLTVSGADLTAARESAVNESLAGVSRAAHFTVERGYQADNATRIVQLVLLGLGAVLMLGGTLTATFLALSDARPDLATLSAVGASPRRRRGIAAAYAVVVGVVGALLGVVVGFIPGIAITYPLTHTAGATGDAAGPYLDVPWLEILALVVVLPLLTALVVGAAVRSRLPLVSRLD